LIEELTDGGIGCRLIGCPIVLLSEDCRATYWLMDYIVLIVLVDYRIEGRMAD
jgi:hypothetical protein